MKKILFYIHSLNRGGAERVLLTLAEGLKNKYKITILTDVYEEREYDLPEGITRINIGNKEFRGKLGRIQSLAWRFSSIRKYCKNEKADIIIVFMISSVIRAVLANIFTRNTIIGAVRSNPYDDFGSRKQQAKLNVIFGRLSGIVCQTEYQKEYFNSSNQAKTKVIANPIVMEFCTDSDKVIRKDKIVCVGRLFDYKNHKLLIKAFSKICSKFPSYELAIYGEGPYRNELEEYIKTLQLEHKVSLPGDVSNVSDHIKDAKLFVLPSDTEGMPNALMEAMALGLPVVATDCPCGGPKSLITEGVNGLLCMVNDVEGLASQMERILSDEQFAVQLGTNATEIRQSCSVTNICQKWSEYIESF